MTRRRVVGRPSDWASDWPRSAVSGAPTASANADALEIRCSGSISRPPVSAARELGRQARRELVELEDVAVARRGADQQRPERGREAEDVAGGGHGAAGEDLGRHVARRADRDRSLVLLGAERAGDAEVHQDHAVVAEDHVLRLDVAVHDLLAVHVGQRLAPVADVLDRVPEREARIAAALEDRAQVHAVDEVHDDVETLVVAGVIEHLHDARVAQAGQQARLDLEARSAPTSIALASLCGRVLISSVYLSSSLDPSQPSSCVTQTSWPRRRSTRSTE